MICECEADAYCKEHALVVVPVRLEMYCPAGHQHVDEGEWATRPHKTHQCQVPIRVRTYDDDGIRYHDEQKTCGLEWRPADFPTVGVERLK